MRLADQFQQVLWLQGQDTYEAIQLVKGKEDLEGVPIGEVQKILSEIINQSVEEQLNNILSRETQKKVLRTIRNAIEYSEVAETASGIGILLPSFSKEQLSVLMAQEEALCRELSANRARKRRVGAWRDKFFPRILGLYSALSGDEPRYTFGDHDQSAQKTLVFIEKVLSAVVEQQKSLHFERVLSGIPSDIKLSWSLPSLRRISELVQEYKHVASRDAKDEMMWEKFQKEYRERLLAC